MARDPILSDTVRDGHEAAMRALESTYERHLRAMEFNRQSSEFLAQDLLASLRAIAALPDCPAARKLAKAALRKAGRC